jgi:UDP-glucuronate 4-epimerase
MKVVITGAAGFIGFHTSKVLLLNGHTVIGIDNLNDYYDVRLKNFRLDSLKENGKFTFIKCDLSEREACEAAFSMDGVDVVIHLAAQAGVRYSIINPYSYTKNNVDAFLNILEACRHKKIKRLCYASSSSVYGGLKTYPFDETMQVDTPISLYASTKKANELMAHTYSHLYGVETYGFRFFTVYGPMGRPDMAMWLFADAILKGEPIKVFNHGKMKRDFTYIDDIVSGLIASIDAVMPSNSEVFNLGNNKIEELGDMIKYLELYLGKEAKKEMLPMQAGDVAETYANVDKAKKYLKFSPSTKLEDGIKSFTNWFMNDWLPCADKLK